MQSANWTMHNTKNRGMATSQSTYVEDMQTRTYRGQSPNLKNLKPSQISKTESGLAKSTHFALGSDKNKVISEAQQNYGEQDSNHKANTFVIS